jgi:hypothetical protein
MVNVVLSTGFRGCGNYLKYQESRAAEPTAIKIFSARHAAPPALPHFNGAGAAANL